MIRYCTVGNWAVSQTSGDGIKGVILNVHDVTSRPMIVREKRPFATHEEADAYCLDKGYIRIYDGKSNA